MMINLTLWVEVTFISVRLLGYYGREIFSLRGYQSTLTPQ